MTYQHMAKVVVLWVTLSLLISTPRAFSQMVQHEPQDHERGYGTHRNPVAAGEVLQDELAVAAAEEREEPKEVEQEADHRAGIFAGSSRQITHLPAGRSFGEGQASTWPFCAS